MFHNTRRKLHEPTSTSADGLMSHRLPACVGPPGVIYVHIYAQNGGFSPWLPHRLEAYATLTSGV